MLGRGFESQLGDTIDVTLDPVDKTKISCCGCELGECYEVEVGMRNEAGVLTNMRPRATPHFNKLFSQPVAEAEPSTPPQSPTAAREANQIEAPTSAPSQEMAQAAATAEKEEVTVPEEQAAELGCCGLCPGVHPLDVFELFGETTWMLYLICCGCGSSARLGGCWLRISGFGCHYNLEPVLLSGVDVDEDGFEDGVCGWVHTCCLTSCIAQYPKRGGTPNCKCFDFECCAGAPDKNAPDTSGIEASRKIEEQTMNFWDFLLYDNRNIVPCYCSHWGCIAHQTFMGCAKSHTKCCGCLARCSCGIPPEFFAEDGGGEETTCQALCSCWQLRGQIMCPPLEPRLGNPVIACCGWKCRKPRSHAGSVENQKATIMKATDAKTLSKPIPVLM